MSLIKYRELKRRFQLDGPQKTVAHLSEALSEGHLVPEDFSIRDLAETLIPDGHRWVNTLDPRAGWDAGLLEADGVDVTAFSNVTGQVIYTKIIQAYEQEAFVVSKLVDTVPTRFDGEKIPGVSRVRDEAAEVHPGMPYPHLGFGEDYIETPSTTKRGFIVPVTKEAIFFDRTHLILSRAAEVGEVLGLNKEKRLIDLLIGAVNNFKWKGNPYDTYYASGGHPLAAEDGGWTNELASNELVDWTDVDAAEQLFADILDPGTGEPIIGAPTDVIVTPAYRHAANRVFGATQTRFTASGAATETISENPLRGRYSLHESRLLYRRIIAAGETAADAKKWWFVGDLNRAFAYMQNWPITVTHSAAGSEADFNADVVIRYKASERGAAAVINPRYVVKSTG